MYFSFEPDSRCIGVSGVSLSDGRSRGGTGRHRGSAKTVQVD
jgi:hypothetical protein